MPANFDCYHHDGADGINTVIVKLIDENLVASPFPLLEVRLAGLMGLPGLLVRRKHVCLPFYDCPDGLDGRRLWSWFSTSDRELPDQIRCICRVGSNGRLCRRQSV